MFAPDVAVKLCLHVNGSSLEANMTLLGIFDFSYLVIASPEMLKKKKKKKKSVLHTYSSHGLVVSLQKSF